jgi:biopolymer transport protein ExbD
VKLRRTIRPLPRVIDMTALIDVVLLLLIFFMLSSSFVLQPGIEVNPPRGFHSGVRDSRHIVTVLAQEPSPDLF